MRIKSLTTVDGSLKQLTLPRISEVEHPQAGQLAVDNFQLMLNTGEAWNTVIDAGEPLYTFTSHRFLVPVGSNASTGPTLAQCNSAYVGAPFLGDTTLFDVFNGIQRWTVPESGIYRIELVGASNTALSYPAKVEVECVLHKSDVLELIVGQQSSRDHGCSLVRLQASDLIAISAGAAAGTSTTATSSNHVALEFDSEDPAPGAHVAAHGISANGGAGYVDFEPAGIYASGLLSSPPPGLAKEVAGYGGWAVSRFIVAGGGQQFLLTQSGGFGGGGGGGSRVESTVYVSLGGGGGYRGGDAVVISYRNGQPSSYRGNPGTCFANDAKVLSKSISRVNALGQGYIVVTKL